MGGDGALPGGSQAGTDGLHRAAILRCLHDHLPDLLAVYAFGSRVIAVHDDQALQLPVVVAIITRHLGDLLEYAQVILLRDGRD